MTSTETTILTLTQALARVTEQRDRLRGVCGATLRVIAEALESDADEAQLRNALRELHAGLARTVDATLRATPDEVEP